MKNLRNYYAAFLLFALLFVAAAAPAQTDLQQKLGRISAITETRPLELSLIHIYLRYEKD